MDILDSEPLRLTANPAYALMTVANLTQAHLGLSAHKCTTTGASVHHERNLHFCQSIGIGSRPASS